MSVVLWQPGLANLLKQGAENEVCVMTELARSSIVGEMELCLCWVQPDRGWNVSVTLGLCWVVLG